MLAFIDSHVVNLDQVKYIEPLRKNGQQARMRVHFGADEALTLDYDMWDMHKFMGHVVQAHPGYYVIEAFSPDETGEGEWSFIENPVIAFRTDGEDCPIAITTDGEVQGGQFVVVAPNGRATNTERRFKDAQEWKDLLIAGSKPGEPAPQG